MQALIDENLVNESMGAKIIASATIACKIIKAPIPKTIHWRRSIQQLLSNEAVVCHIFMQITIFVIHFICSSIEPHQLCNLLIFGIIPTTFFLLLYRISPINMTTKIFYYIL